MARRCSTRRRVAATALWAACALPATAAASPPSPPLPSGAPHTPPGLPACAATSLLHGPLPRRLGEAARYLVEVDGLHVGSIDFRIERRGVFAAEPVTDYRSIFKLDGLMASFVPVEGRAAALLADRGGAAGEPVLRRAMNRFRLDHADIEEELSLGAAGRALHVERRKQGSHTVADRALSLPVVDFVTGFYLLRQLAPQVASCALVFGNDRVYTVWAEPRGIEPVKTPVGLRAADLYAVRFASERAAKVSCGRLWMGRDAARMPLRAELDGPHHLVATLHTLAPGEAAAAAP